MKETTIKKTVTIGPNPTVLALCITMLSGLWRPEAQRIVKTLATYFEVYL